jgi:hypothetical protein
MIDTAGGETTPRQNKLCQFIANIMIYIKNIYYTLMEYILVFTDDKFQFV